MINYFSLGDIIGYLGVILLMARFIPVMIKEIKNIKDLKYRSIEPFFIIIETVSCSLMAISAYMRMAMPFIIANSFTFVCYILLSSIHIIKFIKRTNCFQKNIWAAPPPKD